MIRKLLMAWSPNDWGMNEDDASREGGSTPIIIVRWDEYVSLDQTNFM